MERTDYTIALLIDCENISAKYISAVNKELILFGRVTYKRMYGDFTGGQLNAWKEMVNEYAITPIQQFSYTSGKNATDSKIIIDAMDILYSGKVNAFCIMSSDSDYTGLVKRLKESDIYVIGAGEEKTPRSFVNACDRFFEVKELKEKYESGSKQSKENEESQSLKVAEPLETMHETKTAESKESTRECVEDTKRQEECLIEQTEEIESDGVETPPKEEIEKFAYIFLESQSNHTAPLEMVINKIYQAYPDFSITKYGVKKAYHFFSEEIFWVKKSENGSHMHIGIRDDIMDEVKTEKAVEIEPSMNVVQFESRLEKLLISVAKRILKKEGKAIDIGTLCKKIYADQKFKTKHPDFKFKKGEGKSFFVKNGFCVKPNASGTIFIALQEE